MMKDNNEFIDPGVDEHGAIREPSFAYLVENIFYDKGFAKLIIHWGDKLSKNYQLLQLKKICPILRNISIKDLFELIKDKDEEWEFAVMGYGEGQNLVEEAKELGLQIRVEKIDT